MLPAKPELGITENSTNILMDDKSRNSLKKADNTMCSCDTGFFRQCTRAPGCWTGDPVAKRMAHVCYGLCGQWKRATVC